jgi:hypothetical protein
VVDTAGGSHPARFAPSRSSSYSSSRPLYERFGIGMAWSWIGIWKVKVRNKRVGNHPLRFDNLRATEHDVQVVGAQAAWSGLGRLAD